MSEEISYQNPDLSATNPLTPRNPNSGSPTTNLKNFSLPKDPKIRLLIKLAIVVCCLLLITFVVTTVRQFQNNRPIKITPIVTQAPRPTDVPDTSNFPQDLKDKFDEVDKNTQIQVNFNPPQIDNTIGL